ncbi:MAG: ATP-binding cassette domain-containing protein [Anaerolineales bacterium]|nr:ATP-binding cassette domain-containing protein [Anaerolineales bacterium]
MIELKDLSYAYPGNDVDALKSLNLRIESGDMVLIAGASGTGKSTLLRTINGLVPHFFGGRFRGQALINGLDTRSASPMQLARKVGMVFQEPGMRFLTTNVIDEIAFGTESVGSTGEEIQRYVDEIFERLDLRTLEGRSLDRISAGEQQRVAVASAVGRRPEILLLDEPTSQLDETSAETILDWIEDLKEQFGLTVVITEHRLDRVLNRVDQVVYLSKGGRIELDGRPADVLGALSENHHLYKAAGRIGLIRPAREGKQPVHVSYGRNRGLEPVNEWPSRPVRLEALGISFKYNGISALNGIDICIHPGEVVALIGQNGAGKTTLLRCLVGLIEPEAGEIRLDNERINGLPVAELAKKIAYVPQWPSALLFSESVLEELRFTLRNHGIEDDPPIPPGDLLERLGLSGVSQRYPRDLSAGQRQRVALASMLITKPNIILLDEPTLGMDPGNGQCLFKLLEEWKADGTGILIATHDVSYAAEHADRVVVMDHGRIIAEGTPQEVLNGASENRFHYGRSSCIERVKPNSVSDELNSERGIYADS